MGAGGGHGGKDQRRALGLIRNTVALLSSAMSACTGAETREPSLEVGIVVPFAGTGVMADAERAWSLVVDHVNENGGAGGRELRVQERDAPLSDASDLSPIARGFVDLADAGCDYIISLVSGAALAPIVEAAVPRGVLMMSITSEEAASELPPSDGLLLRGILPTDRVLAEQARDLQASGRLSLAIVGETRAGQPDPRQAAMAKVFACSSCSVFSTTYPAEADLYRYDWRGLAEQVTAPQPDVIFLASANSAALVDAIYAIDSRGYAGEYHFAYGALMTMVADALGRPEAATRFRSYDLALEPSHTLDRFLASYERAHGESVVPEPRILAFADYLALISLAVAQVGSDEPRRVADAMKRIAGPPGEAFGVLDYSEAKSALRGGRDVDFIGLSGPLDFDEHGEVSAGFVQQYALDATGRVVPAP